MELTEADKKRIQEEEEYRKKVQEEESYRAQLRGNSTQGRSNGINLFVILPLLFFVFIGSAYYFYFNLGLAILAFILIAGLLIWSKHFRRGKS